MTNTSNYMNKKVVCFTKDIPLSKNNLYSFYIIMKQYWIWRNYQIAWQVEEKLDAKNSELAIVLSQCINISQPPARLIP